jgi:hypothetical protein
MLQNTASNPIRKAMGILGIIVIIAVPTMGLPLGLTSDMQSPASRFQILEEYKGEAVLDAETHLIWERSPSSAETAWANASLRCAFTATGGRLGWRLPSFFELMTLVEPGSPTAASKPSLPSGHPFRGVKADPYWTISSQDSEPANAYTVDFLRGDVTLKRKNRAHAWWCVRGGTSNIPATTTSSGVQEPI